MGCSRPIGKASPVLGLGSKEGSDVRRGDARGSATIEQSAVSVSRYWKKHLAIQRRKEYRSERR